MSTPSARTGGSLDAWFKISQRGSTVRQEVVAGLTTFLAGCSLMSTPSARTGGSLDAWFKISQRGSTVRQEVVAGLTTFLAMVYSVIVDRRSRHVG